MLCDASHDYKRKLSAVSLPGRARYPCASKSQHVNYANLFWVGDAWNRVRVVKIDRSFRAAMQSNIKRIVGCLSRGHVKERHIVVAAVITSTRRQTHPCSSLLLQKYLRLPPTALPARYRPEERRLP